MFFHIVSAFDSNNNDDDDDDNNNNNNNNIIRNLYSAIMPLGKNQLYRQSETNQMLHPVTLY